MENLKSFEGYSVKNRNLDGTSELSSKYFDAYDKTNTAKEWHIYFKSTEEGYRQWAAAIKYENILIIDFKSELNIEEFEDFIKLFEDIKMRFVANIKYNL